MQRLPAFLLASFLLAGLAAAAASGPELTELERLKVEVLTTKAQLVRAIADADQCRAELAPVRSTVNARAVDDETAKLKAALEAAHPGQVWNPRTGLLEPAPTKSPTP